MIIINNTNHLLAFLIILFAFIICGYSVKSVCETFKQLISNKSINMVIAIVTVGISVIVYLTVGLLISENSVGDIPETNLKVYNDSGELLEEYTGEIDIITYEEGKVSFIYDSTMHTCYDCQIVISEVGKEE